MAQRKVHNGCPPGEGSIKPEHGGQIGNPPHVYSDELAQRIEDLSQYATQAQVAETVGIGHETLKRHYHEAWLRGNTKARVEVKKGILQQAREGNTNAAKVFLALSGELKRQVEVAAPGGGPVRVLDVAAMAKMVEGKSDEELHALEQALNLVLAATGSEGGPDHGNPAAGLPPAGAETAGA